MTNFYNDLATWWPLCSRAVHYIEEADDLLRRLAPLPAPGSATLLGRDVFIARPEKRS